MYTTLAITLSAAAFISANPVPAKPLRQHQIQQLQNNFNPNLLDPKEAKSDHKIYAGSIASNFRPELDSDYPYVQDTKRGAEIQAGPADNKASGLDAADDVPDQNQIMNEISNIIRQNNMKVRNIKHSGNSKVEAPESPMLNENLAEPIFNAQDPNNVEQFEKVPRVNERIPIVNREIFKVPNIKQRIPIANDNEGIVYNAPKVHERIPIKNEIKLNDLEDTNNIDTVINKLDDSMKAKGEFHSKLHLDKKAAVHEHKIRAGSHGDGYRPDLCDNDSCWPLLYDEKQGGQVRAKGAAKVEGENANGHQIQNHGDLIHHDHHHHLHRGADMVDKAAKAA